MSKRSNWEYDVFLGSSQKQNELPLASDCPLSREHRLDFGPDYGVNH